MIYYRKETTTRGHGLLGSVFAGILMAAFAIGLYVTRDDTSSGRSIAYLIAVPVMLVCCWVIAISLFHLLRPQVAFVEISDDAISWRDWGGFHMVHSSYPISAVKAICSPDEMSDCLVLQDGTAVSLPSLVIPNQEEFNAALRQVAPRIEFITN